MSRTPPHDQAAERALIGAALLSDHVIVTASHYLDARDFYPDSHQHIWHAITTAYAEGSVDPITVAAVLARKGHKGSPFTAPDLFAFTTDTPSVSSADRYARTVADCSVRRNVIKAAGEVIDAAYVMDAETALETASERFGNIEQPTGKPVPDPDFITFMESHDSDYDWCIPDMLEHRDRLLITAAEGAGKSTLLAQIGVMAAAGIHPWTMRPITPRNVAIIDLENSPRLVSRRLRAMRAAAVKTRADLDRGRLRVASRPDGLDLTGRADRRWLTERCIANQTEILVIGPAYRMSAGVAERGDIGGENQAREVTKALDETRNRCNVTLIMETHAPHGNQYGRDLRPFGSSVWLRWPEFGIGIHTDGDDDRSYIVKHWRGPRDVRPWPSALSRGGPDWPWHPIMPTRRPA